MLLNVHHLGDRAGPPLVCLHGVSGYGRRFAALADRLGDRHVIAPDLRGHGDSGKEPPWDIATHLADLLETVDELHADWLGFSFGGRLAAEIAVRHPERVRSLILLDPALHIPPPVAHARADGARHQETYASLREAMEGQRDDQDPFPIAEDVLEAEVRENFEHADGVYTARWDPAMAVVAFSEMARPAPPPAQLPTLSVEGDASWIPPYGRGDVVRLRAGHRVLWDAFDETADAVRRHLRSRP